MRIKVELAQEWAKLKKSSSVWIAGIFTAIFSIPDAIDFAWHHIPDDLKSAIPGHWATGLAGACFGLTFLARIFRVKLMLRKGDQDAPSAPDQAN